MNRVSNFSAGGSLGQHVFAPTAALRSPMVHAVHRLPIRRATDDNRARSDVRQASGRCQAGRCHPRVSRGCRVPRASWLADGCTLTILADRRRRIDVSGLTLVKARRSQVRSSPCWVSGRTQDLLSAICTKARLTYPVELRGSLGLLGAKTAPARRST